MAPEPGWGRPERKATGFSRVTGRRWPLLWPTTTSTSRGALTRNATSDHEWGDDNDKINLLVKLNVLGTDSSTNLQIVTNSTSSDAGTGLGSRTVRVGADPTGSFVAVGDFFLLGADIDIIDSNTAPTVKITQPDGTGDVANTEYFIQYDLTDLDDDFISTTTGLQAALYFSEHSNLTTVQDIRILGTLIVDENDNTVVFASGTDDFSEGKNQTYRWDDPIAALKAKLFASIFKVPSGDYYIYLVADDRKNPPVFARSSGTLTILHKPIVDFLDPVAGLDTVDTGVRTGALANPYDLDFTVRDFDLQGTAEVQLFFSTVSGLSSLSVAGVFPNQKLALGKSLAGKRATAIEKSDTLTTADTDFSWDVTDSVFVSPDSTIVAQGAYFIYVWNFRNPPNDVPEDGQKVWLYTVISDAKGNKSEVLGGALTVYHSPYVNLLTSKLDDFIGFDQNDVLRVEWDDYLVDDGTGTDDAFIRVYATESPSGFTFLESLDSAVDGISTFLLNSSNGEKSGTIRTIRESDANFIDWNTKLFGNATTNYDIYVGIAADESFVNNRIGGIQLSKSSTALSMGTGGASPNISVSPTDQSVAIGDTFTFDVMVQHSQPINLVQIVITLEDNLDFVVRDQDSNTVGTQPFIDLDSVFVGTDPIENTFLSSALQLRFTKSTFSGEVVGSRTEPTPLARFQLVAQSGLGVTASSVVFSGGDTGTVLGVVGQAQPFQSGTGLTLSNPQLRQVRRGRIVARVRLEGRSIPPATGDHTSLIDVHLRLPGSTIDIVDANFKLANDDDTATADTVEVQTASSGALSLVSIPAGRYVLTVKDTSHVSGRSDTITVRRGEVITLFSTASSTGFFGSDLRGDPTSLLPLGGTELIAGDVTEDNEINEDDVNLIVTVWGAGGTSLNHFRSDINNDGDVTAADLTVTTSNFGNSEGFGAPPVYKPTSVLAGGGPRPVSSCHD